MIPYKDLFIALSQEKIRYLVAGGFAVNFHQVQRATVDLDLIVLLEKSNIEKFVQLVTRLGYLPRLPVDPRDLADPKSRSDWVKSKGMTVFSFYHCSNSFEILDLFVEEPFPFSEMEAERLEVSSFGIKIPVLGKRHLIELKRCAGRDKDLFDIQQLEKAESSE